MENNLSALRTQADWMRKKLDETRIDLSSQSVVMDYDNGGGQTGTRKNPAFDAYNALMANYRSTLKAIDELTRDTDEDDGMTLDELRA